MSDITFNEVLEKIAQGKLDEFCDFYQSVALEFPTFDLFDDNRKWAGESLKGKSIVIAIFNLAETIRLLLSLHDFVQKNNPSKIYLISAKRLIKIIERSGLRIDIHCIRCDNEEEWEQIKNDYDIDYCLESCQTFTFKNFEELEESASKIDINIADDRIRFWKKRYNKFFNVGIGYATRTPEFSETRIIHKESLKLFESDKFQLIDLQYPFEGLERINLKNSVYFEDSDPLESFEDFFAQIAACDAIVTNDQSLLYFAGLLKIPTFCIRHVEPLSLSQFALSLAYPLSKNFYRSAWFQNTYIKIIDMTKQKENKDAFYRVLELIEVLRLEKLKKLEKQSRSVHWQGISYYMTSPGTSNSFEKGGFS